MAQRNDQELIPLRLGGLYHRTAHQLALYFDDYGSLNNLVRKAGARWTRTHHCWIIPLNKTNYEKIMAACAGKAVVNRDALDVYMREQGLVNSGKAIESKISSTPGIGSSIITKPVLGGSATNNQPPITQLNKETDKAGSLKIHAVNAHLLPAMRQTLILKGYSKSTIRTYLHEMSAYLQTLGGQPADEMSIQRIKDYLSWCHSTLKLSENTIHSRMNSLKFYYEQVLSKEHFTWEIPRPKKQQQLPKFFTQDEIAAIIKSVENLKHKTMLMLCYSTGMRVSEVVSLMTFNIVSSRMCITVLQGKGKKDRVVSLSPVLLVMLREYFKKYKPSKTGFLFQGQQTGECYSIRSLQEVLQQAKTKASIIKPGGMHALRHSFATHLLDKGTDISMIQKLLGHNDIKTTLRYLHTSNKDLLRIISPLDDLNLE